MLHLDKTNWKSDAKLISAKLTSKSFFVTILIESWKTDFEDSFSRDFMSLYSMMTLVSVRKTNEKKYIASSDKYIHP